MRDPIGRESSRDFPPRDIPRGPKAEIEPPRGPRGASYAGDFRGDFGYRGDFRGRGRARARASGWRDESRDRGRELDRDFRGSRDDRGPPPFRDDRSRDRDRWDRNDTFRGRRPSSPQGRGRSPNYGAREPRDVPSILDVDRARRGSRDGPLSAVSPSSESLPFRGSYGRGRARGRGRGGYNESYHDRNQSPDPSWNRRTQPSATPPPQVPAFGSTSASIPIPSAPKAHNVPTGPILSPLAGIPVPTGPRAGRQTPASIQWINPEIAKKEVSRQQSTLTSPVKSASPVTVTSPVPSAFSDAPQQKESPPYEPELPETPKPESFHQSPSPIVQEQPEISIPKRRRCVGTIIPSVATKEPTPAPEGDADDSDADSDDSIDNGDFFEEDMRKIEDQISKLPKKPEDDETLNFAHLAKILHQPIPDPSDKEKIKQWEDELVIQKDLKQKEYERKLLAINP